MQRLRIMRLDRLLANLGYGSRREVGAFIRDGRVSLADGTPADEGTRAAHGDLRFDGEPLDPASPLTLILYKPAGFTCSSEDAGPLIYDLLPGRFARRNPPLSSVGRLDKETSGLLLMTDDGALLHRLISPRKRVWKSYEAILARPLQGSETGIFASGTLVLDGESKPCLPARLEIISEQRARLHLAEGRYHQVRRMFAAVGNHVLELHRSQIGGLTLGALAPGEWRIATADDLQAMLSPTEPP